MMDARRDRRTAIPAFFSGLRRLEVAQPALRDHTDPGSGSISLTHYRPPGGRLGLLAIHNRAETLVHCVGPHAGKWRQHCGIEAISLYGESRGDIVKPEYI